MKRNAEKIRLEIYAAAHFVVDLGCALLILGRVCPDWDPMVAILLYNLFAFAVQMPVGLIADRLGKSHIFAAAGCLLVLAGWGISAGLAAGTAFAGDSTGLAVNTASAGASVRFVISTASIGMAAVVTAGLGNAVFHVGGGLYALNREGYRAGPLGLFVAPGAFGVYLGGRFAFRALAWPVCLLLIVAASALLLFGKNCENDLSTPGRHSDRSNPPGQPGRTCLQEPSNPPDQPGRTCLQEPSNPPDQPGPLVQPYLPPLKMKNWKLWSAALCLFAVVVLRSLLGLAADLPWKEGLGLAGDLFSKTGLGLAAVCAVAGGKAAGGYLADRFGVMTVAVVSLGASAFAFLWGYHPAAGLAALFLFNMTMPLTLWAMAELFPGAKGYSFGLLTFGLFLGFLPVYFGYGGMGPLALAAGTLFSLLLLAVGLCQVKGCRNGTD